MSIKQLRPDKWLVDVRVIVKGKQYRKRETFNGGSKEAKYRYQILRRELQEKARSDCSLKLRAERISTFSGVMDFYLARRPVEPDSMSYFNRFKADLGNIPLSDFAVSFDRWLLLLRQGKCKRTGRAFAPATINRYIAWAKAALNFAVSYGVIEKNPIAHIKKSKEIPRDIVLNDVEKQNLFNVLEREAPFLVPLVKFALLVPCRTGELLAMRRDALDLFNGVIRVPCGVMKNKELATWKPIPPSMREYFEALPASAEYLFFRKTGERYARIKVFPYELLRRCLKLAGLQGWRLHDGRHQAVSSLLNNGTPEMTVVQIAGWTSSAMLRTYYHRDGLQSVKMVRFGDEPVGKVSTCTSFRGAAV